MLVDINLLPQKERDRPASLIAALLILLIGIAIWAVFAFLANGLEQERAALAADSAQLAAEQAAIRSQLEQTQGLNEEQQLKVTVDWAESYQFDTVPLLEELVSKLPKRGFFDSFSYTGLDQATLTVQFDTAREAAYYLTQLKASDILASASLDAVTQEEIASGSIEEDGEIVDENAPILNPRYLATYTLIFVDERVPPLTPEGEIADQAAPPAEGQPAVEEPAEDVDVEVDVNEETPTAPETPATPVEPEETEETLR